MLHSIKSKLILWFLSVSSVGFALLGIYLYYTLEKIVIGSVDNHLHSEVQLIASLLEVEGREIEVALSEAAVGEYAVPLSGHYYQIISSDGSVLSRSPSLSLVDAYLPTTPGTPTPTLQTIAAREKVSLRLLTQSFRLPDGKTLTLQASEPLEDSFLLLRSFRNILLALIPTVIVLSGLGIWLIAGWSLRPLRLFSGKIERITGRNLDERIEGEAADRELRPLAFSFNRMLGRLETFFTKQSRFLADASHQLRTPAAVIKSACDVTLQRERTAAEYRETLGKIAEATHRITETLHRILELSRMEERTSMLKFTGVDLIDLLRDVQRLLEPSAAAKEIFMTLDGKSLTVQGDRERLMEAVTNLADNAVKYNHPGGRVELRLDRREDQAVIAISDTGIGIPDAEKEKVFERFYRREAGGHPAGGSGLGLPIAEAIVQAHGGRIEVESTVGKGSRFRILLPIGKPSHP